MAIIAGLVSCNDDYTDWASPQSNSENEAVEKFTLTVQPAVSSIDFATETAESIQLFSTNLQSGQTDAYNVAFSAENVTETVVLTAASDGTVASAELQDVVATIYGKAPVERTLSVKVSADVAISTADGTIVAEKEAQPFTLNITLDAPQISEHYYLIGAPSSWDMADTSLPFSHSGKNVYDDPVLLVRSLSRMVKFGLPLRMTLRLNRTIGHMYLAVQKAMAKWYGREAKTSFRIDR